MLDNDQNKIKNLITNKVIETENAKPTIIIHSQNSTIFNGCITINHIANDQSLEEVVKKHILGNKR
ncbi:MAG: hypothetical protein HRU28_04440 [Rhizobiales bacterium]|nr:hypothetical protein [Hyphomicrobiales bacterium]